METRRTTLRKRKAKEHRENQVLQKQMFELSIQPDLEIGPRDIVMGDDKSSNTNNDFNIKKEIKVELREERESEIVPNEIEFQLNTIKVEIKEEAVVVVTEEEMLFDDDSTTNISNDVNVDISDPFNKQEHTEDFQISTNSDLSYIEDATHQSTMKKVIATKKRHQTTTDNSNPFTDATYEARLRTETQHLEKILPRKVWVRAFKTLEDSEFLVLTNSSPFYRTLLSKPRVYFLYMPVFKVIVPYLAGNSEIQMKTEAQPVLLLSRTVCQKWKEIVDTVVSTWYLNNQILGGLTSPTLSFWLSYKYSFANFTKTAEKFIEMFKVTHCSRTDNPFFGRYLRIEACTNRAKTRFKTDLAPIVTLLESYGCHILTCRITICSPNPLKLQTQPKIFDWLRRVPKIQTLKVFFTHCTHWQEDGFVPPNLENLRSLDLVNAFPNFLNKILNTNRNIVWLRVSRDDDCKPDPEYFVSLKGLENLECLSVTVQSRYDIKYLRKLNSPLKDLTLRNEISIPGIWVINLLRFSKISKTLEALHLCHLTNGPGKTNFPGYSFHGRLNLPKLKKLCLEITDFVCLDFLLSAKLSLETICIKTHSVDLCVKNNKQYMAIKKKQIIQFLGYEDKVNDSNIWRMLPNLKKVWIESAGIKRKYVRRASM